jgi:hypothetical protein
LLRLEGHTELNECPSFVGVLGTSRFWGVGVVLGFYVRT